MVKKIQQVVNVVPEETPDYSQLAQELKVINSQMNSLKKKDAEIKGKMTEGYFTNKVENQDGTVSYIPKVPTDGRGNSYLETLGHDGKPIILKREARISIKLNKEKAEKFFKSKNLLKEVSIQETVFDEDAISQLFSEGVITPDEFESICDKNVSYALKFVKAIEDEEDAT